MASLVADYGTSGSENELSPDLSDSENENRSEEGKVEEGRKNKLPPPSFSSSGGSVKNSVFVNPYVEEENSKMAVLEKHVKMVPQKKLLSSINGKKVCWMYRKGRCRFGHTCKFAHDSDIISQNPESSQEETEGDGGSSKAAVDQVNENSKRPIQNTTFEPVTPTKKKKKKPGLTQGLVPGKKVMKMFKKSSDLLAP